MFGFSVILVDRFPLSHLASFDDRLFLALSETPLLHVAGLQYNTS